MKIRFNSMNVKRFRSCKMLLNRFSAEIRKSVLCGEIVDFGDQAALEQDFEV